MNSPMPNFYELFHFDRAATGEQLGRDIAGRDLDLEREGVADTDPRRRQLQTAFAVLTDEHRRATYDDALSASLRMTWDDLEHLGNFGSFPDANLRPQAPTYPQAQPQAGASAYNYPTYTPQAPQPGQVGDPFASASSYTAGVPAYQPYGAQHAGLTRPSAWPRFGMVFLDGLLFAIVSSMLLVAVDTSTWVGGVIVGLLGLAWFLGFETQTGASPAKHLFGYTVRDQTTGEKLSWEQSLKRQWWRAVNVVPGVGTLVAFFAMIAIGMSIKPETGFIGSHDRWANAEVVKKAGR